MVKGIIGLIHQTIKEIQLPKRFRLLNFFFGRSRHLAIEKNMQNLQIICGKTLSLLSNTQKLTASNSYLSNQLEELNETVVQTRLSTKGRKSIQKIIQNLIPLNDIIKLQLKKLMHSQELIEKEAALEHEKIDQWMKKCT